ncbi:MAG: UpxY family transcription antiterminator [Bacteroidetes bacterium]|nr:MAG: UpxY family transcription antiterminator [Bacteroidota bacterium]
MRKKKWLALYTRPRFEKKIYKILNEKNITCYLPLVKTMRQWTDRRKWVEVPLFSSYLFVQIDDLSFTEVLNTPGALRFISFDGKVVEIPEKEIDNIKWVLSTDIITNPLEEKIPSGSHVQIVKGPLSGLSAEMVNYNNKNIIIVRIDQLDKTFEIHIPRNHVKLVKEQAK